MSPHCDPQLAPIPVPALPTWVHPGESAGAAALFQDGRRGASQGWWEEGAPRGEEAQGPKHPIACPV